MATGIVKWFNNEKGFGFITPDGGGSDLFAHHTEIQGTGYRSLDEGAKVAFEPKQGPKGLQASQIRKL
ncbi:cold-shock protein [Cupriavidus basilensis]|uniref:cold-shock protein n=1 Tax=Cupriavidus basilensis TaxID=68895 RepID=UPI0023E7E2C4|nr:cold-shock protein [Cupriavidus basilensis]MDF3883136.1 cold-shock protein [Cupriavidus basilensis]